MVLFQNCPKNFLVKIFQIKNKFWRCIFRSLERHRIEGALVHRRTLASEEDERIANPGKPGFCGLPQKAALKRVADFRKEKGDLR